MDVNKLKYLQGMKYVLSEDIIFQTPVLGYNITDQFFTLSENGKLLIRTGFAWDGASGPTIDTKDCLAASLVHDVFCICMRDYRISYAQWQPTINKFFRDMCIANGMPVWRADLWHKGVTIGDAGNPIQGPDRKVLEVSAKTTLEV